MDIFQLYFIAVERTKYVLRAEFLSLRSSQKILYHNIKSTIVHLEFSGRFPDVIEIKND